MNKSTLTILTVLVASALILSACAARADPATLNGTSWTLVSYGDVNHPIPAAAGIHTSLTFSTAGQVSGNLGCNGFSGDYQVKAGKLVFGPLASTLMACPEPQMTQESVAFRVLAGKVNFTIAGNTLTIYDTTGAVELNLSQGISQ